MTDLNPAPLAQEAARAQALQDLGIWDTAPEPPFDDLARLAALACDAAAGFIAFVDGLSQFFKAVYVKPDAPGFAGKTRLAPAVVELGEMLVVPDAQADARFHGRLAGADSAPMRFGAGVPLRVPNGAAVGALCVADSQARGLSDAQAESLRALGRQVESLLALRLAAGEAARAEAQGRQREANLRGIADSLPALIAYVDTEQRYRFNNRAYDEWLGGPRGHALGRTIREVLGEDYYAAVAGNVSAALAGHAADYEREMAWPDGTTRFVHGRYVPQHGPDGAVQGFAVLVTDETELRRLEAERRAAAGHHEALVAAQQEVARADRNLDAVMEIVARRAQGITAADGAIVEMAEGDDMVCRAASGTAASHIGLRLRRETSLSGRCVAEGRLLVCHDTNTDPRVDKEACRRIGMRSLVVAPVTFLGRTVGVLKVYSASPNAFPDGELPLLEMMVSLIVAALGAVSEDQARTALSWSEQRLHALITSVPVILFALDAGGLFTQSEGKGLDALGLTPGQLVGQSYRDVYAGSAALLDGVARGLTGEASQWLDEVGGVFYETRCLPLADAGGARAGLIGVAFDVTERVQAERGLRQAAARQRRFLRDVLASVTEGRLLLCQSEDELPALLPSASEPMALSLSGGLRELRQALRDVCRATGLAEEREQDMITAVSEAGMNCIVHVGEGVGQVTADTQRGTVQARITDHGQGISLENLPHATLRKGFTTAGTLGHGMKMMLQTADRVFLLTSSKGTTVVVEQERLAPPSAW